MERKDIAPHSVGEVICPSCFHEWTAVFPTFVEKLECPCCGKMVRHGIESPVING